MKNKKTFWAFMLVAIIIAIIFIALELYSLAVVIIIGAIIAGHREIWSLIRYRKMPPNDERVKENINKSVRNSFLAFIIVSLITILLYVTDEPVQPLLEYYLSALLLSVGVVYVISYLFYDRIEANLGSRDIKALNILAIFEVVSLVIFILNALFVNTVFPVITDEIFTLHKLMLYISPVAFSLGIIGSLVIFVKGLLVKAS
ncbi:MAG TPA: hypothetical protein DCR59_03290 [Dehalococcoidia bacterium]|nr:hypothetical protein [Dehalococcoidia bacterium]